MAISHGSYTEMQGSDSVSLNASHGRWGGDKMISCPAAGLPKNIWLVTVENWKLDWSGSAPFNICKNYLIVPGNNIFSAEYNYMKRTLIDEDNIAKIRFLL